MITGAHASPEHPAALRRVEISLIFLRRCASPAPSTLVQDTSYAE